MLTKHKRNAKEHLEVLREPMTFMKTRLQFFEKKLTDCASDLRRLSNLNGIENNRNKKVLLHKFLSVCLDLFHEYHRLLPQHLNVFKNIIKMEERASFETMLNRVKGDFLDPRGSIRKYIDHKLLASNFENLRTLELKQVRDPSNKKKILEGLKLLRAKIYERHNIGGPTGQKKRDSTG